MADTFVDKFKEVATVLRQVYSLYYHSYCWITILLFYISSIIIVNVSMILYREYMWREALHLL